MDNKITAIKDRIIKDDKLIFYVIGIAFFVMCSNAVMFGDDTNANGMRVEGGTIAQYWSTSLGMYATWSSRIFVNFFVFFFTDHPTVFWGAYMGISIYVLLYAFSELFVDGEQGNRKENNVVIAGLVMLFPFLILNSAGWIATATTFLGPAAFGFLSLIPIKKIANRQEMKWWEYIAFSVSLIYGANNEQMMVVILGCYAVATVYLFFVKKFHLYIGVQLVLSVASFFLVALCPGNSIRADLGSFITFPTWGMLNLIDKVDLGYSTTMQWMVFGSNAFFIVPALLLAFLVWKKYQKEGLALAASLPAVFALLFGPLASITTTLYPGAEAITSELDENGLVTVTNRGDMQTLGKYALWAVILIILCVTVLLLQENLRQVLAAFTMLGAGFATRMAMGFSTTIYASMERTFSILIFCILATTCLTYTTSVAHNCVTAETRTKIKLAAYVSIILSLVSLYFSMVK